MRRVTALLSLLFCFTSCSSALQKSNDVFEKKYRDDVKKINEQRRPDKQSKNETIYSKPPTPEEVTKEIASKVEYYPYVDIAEIGDAPKEIFPNRETYEQAKASNPPSSLPVNIFDLSYNLALYPPFHRIGAEFDVISVPKSDAFGVNTELADKSYLLAGNNSLQRAVDAINTNKSAEDVEITKMLVSEKKKIQRQGALSTTSREENQLVNFTKTSEKRSAVKTITPPQNPAPGQVSGFIKSVVKNTDTTPQK